MVMRVDDIRYKVRAKIDELGVNNSDMVDIDDDNMDLDKIVESVLPDALRWVLLKAQAGMLEGVPCKAHVDVDKDGVGRVRLPDDMLRVLSVRLKSWKSSPRYIADEYDPICAMQHDKYARGIPENPVAIVVHRHDGRYLELYSTPDASDELTSLKYVRVPKVYHSPEGDKVLDVPSAIESPFLYYSAGLALLAYGNVAQGNRMMEIAGEML